MSALPADITFPSAARAEAFRAWLDTLQSQYALKAETLAYASADAGFRRYFRVQSDAKTFIVMDAPPELENCEPFVRVAAMMQAAGIAAPQVLAWDKPQGFMLLNDLGLHTLLQAMQLLPESSAQQILDWYMQAIHLLIAWQRSSKPGVLPPYDDTLLRRELQLYPDWYVSHYKRKAFSAEQLAVWQKSTELIIAHNLSQPSVYVHRDYMPRNLMVGQGNTLAVLDFQDAVYGPITYDIAALMRDAFLSWPEDFVIDITVRYWEAARAAQLPVPQDFGEFYKAVEWMGLQRHLKVAGIFARLNYRDHKPKYLADTPRFIDYIRHTTKRYAELAPLYKLINSMEE